MSLTAAEVRQHKAKGRGSRDLHRLHALLADAQTTYHSSDFSHDIAKYLASLTKTSSSPPITRIFSLGLGSLSSAEKGQKRRIKQLALFLAVRDALQARSKTPIEAYAQDPTFTRQDEALLSSLDIRIARTSSGSSLGEAADLIDASTLVYSPFLTLEAYEALLVQSKVEVRYLLGDDFNALQRKWPKYSSERAQVERVMKSALGRYRRKALSGTGFWEEEDGAFPMAVYAPLTASREKARI